MKRTKIFGAFVRSTWMDDLNRDIAACTSPVLAKANRASWRAPNLASRGLQEELDLDRLVRKLDLTGVRAI
jgi:hypothetical protein